MIELLVTSKPRIKKTWKIAEILQAFNPKALKLHT